MSPRKTKPRPPRARPHGTPSTPRRSTDPHGGSTRGRRIPLLLPALVIATLVAYYPAWHGGRLWDDDVHLTLESMQSLQGLGRIWFDVGATPQYYPVVHSAFWMLHLVFGDVTLGYHLVNIVLHACSAFLLALVLRRVSVPGAVLAAAIFALHPVQVESVAWMTELKNVLSGVFYLAAALAYLRFDAGRERRAYALALGLFVLALFSKSVTATLPAALLVVFWWRRGRLNWRQDARPLVPFFAIGAAAGLFTAWVERTLIGAQGEDFQITLIERGLIAGRAIWFYLGKLAWPANLTFIYPRWQVSQHAAGQYLFPIGVVLLLAGLWAWRTRTRAPLAAMLFFGGTLFPALGFLNVYPFRFSFVADHFQYLASIGIIAVVAAGLTTLSARWPAPGRVAAGLALLAPLAALTWHQSGEYVDAETLYRATISRNPACWMAHNNLGTLILQGPSDHVPDAVAEFTEALKSRPAYPEAHNNLGNAWQKLGRFQDALVEHEAALTLNPAYADAHYNLGLDLHGLGRNEEATAQYRETLRINPAFASARSNLAALLEETGRLDEAVAEYREALRLNPGLSEARSDLALALVGLGRLDDAEAEFREALRLAPHSACIRSNLGQLLEQRGRHDEAVTEYRAALDDVPGCAPAETHNDLGVALENLGRTREALAEFEAAVRMQPDFAAARANLAKAQALIKAGKAPEPQ